MIRGTTPTHTFTTDIDLTEATLLYITYTQNGKTIVEKDISEVRVDKNVVTTWLTQTETLKFSAKPQTGIVEIQIRAGFADGGRIASDIIRTDIKNILKDGEI